MLTVFRGRAGDRNPRAMAGTALLADAIAARLDLEQYSVGEPQPPLHLQWDMELAAARPELHALAEAYRRQLLSQRAPVAVIGRCAVALATLPVIAHHRPDACVVWFDAHADSNTPTSVVNPYLGGMVISAAAGLWDSGLGAGLELANVVLVGSRDIDPDELDLIATGAPELVKVGADLPTRLAAAVRGRPAYIHLDCDVLEPGLIPTEYVSPGGLSLQDLHAALAVLARHQIVGFEVAEFEATWPNGVEAVSPHPLVDALMPVLEILCRRSRR